VVLVFFFSNNAHIHLPCTTVVEPQYHFSDEQPCRNDTKIKRVFLRSKNSNRWRWVQKIYGDSLESSSSFVYFVSWQFPTFIMTVQMNIWYGWLKLF